MRQDRREQCLLNNEPLLLEPAHAWRRRPLRYVRRRIGGLASLGTAFNGEREFALVYQIGRGAFIPGKKARVASQIQNSRFPVALGEALRRGPLIR